MKKIAKRFLEILEIKLQQILGFNRKQNDLLCIFRNLTMNTLSIESKGNDSRKQIKQSDQNSLVAHRPTRAAISMSHEVNCI